MPVKSSGTFLKFSEIATEFGDTQPYSMSEYIRGGSLVPDADANINIRNQAQRTAGGVDGRMKFSDYYGAANVFGLEIASNATDVNLATLFAAADATVWTSSLPKILTINSGVIVGATSTAAAALIIPATMGGTLTIVNNGDIQGAGGLANGGNGGDAIQALATVTITNNGNIYAGGGGGGQGGQGGKGGNGSYIAQAPSGGAGGGTGLCASLPALQSCDLSCTNIFGSGHYCPSGQCASIANGLCYSCNSCVYNTTINTTGTDGGAGGAGGVGQGYNQAAGTGANGVAGTSPPTNAGQGGTGGTGGSGGSWGATGVTGYTGNTGANGTTSNGSTGSAGSSGGSGGYYINGISNVTLTNNGNVAGGTI